MDKRILIYYDKNNDNKYTIIKNMKRVYYSRNNNKVFIYNKKNKTINLLC